jgi:hypothetical protein
MRPGRSCPPELRPPAAFVDHPTSVRPARWLRPIRSPVDLTVEVLEIGLEVRLVVLPCHPVHAGSGLALEREERRPECVDVEMVEKRGEPLLSSCALQLAVRGSAPGSRASGSGSGACFAGPRFPWPLPLAPPPPQPAARLCSAASQLLWQSLTSPNRASVTTAPRLPTADRQPSRAFGRSGDLPVPVQGACVHARFSDHAGLAKCSRWRSWTCRLPLHRQCRHPESVFYRGSMAGLHVPLPTLRRHPHECLRTAWGRCGPLLLHRSGLAPPTPCRSPGAPV